MPMRAVLKEALGQGGRLVEDEIGLRHATLLENVGDMPDALAAADLLVLPHDEVVGARGLKALLDLHLRGFHDREDHALVVP